MSNEFEFLARWSRRKHHAATEKIEQSKSKNTPDDIVSSGTSTAPGQDENRLSFDPASLPAIVFIGAELNIRGFLEAGVPGDLDACSASPRVVVRPGDPRFCWFVGELLGLQRAWHDGRLRTNRRKGGREAFDAVVGRTGHNSHRGASVSHITAGRKLSTSRRTRSRSTRN